MAKAAEKIRQVNEGFAAYRLQDEPDTQQVERWVVEIRRVRAVVNEPAVSAINDRQVIKLLLLTNGLPIRGDRILNC